jgi:formiminotetrahydrofolate cyclodeaminase
VVLPPEPGLLTRPLGDVLGALASQHELVGGGAPAAALAAAIAAALTAKAARASRTSWIEAGGAIAHAEALRIQTQALIDRDAQACRAASAVRLERERSARRGVVSSAVQEISPQERERLVDEVLTQAADLALAIAEAANEIVGLAADVARNCHPALKPDALTAVALAEAAANGAARLVDVNRALPAGDERRERAREHARAAAATRESACRPSGRTM